MIIIPLHQSVMKMQTNVPKHRQIGKIQSPIPAHLVAEQIVNPILIAQIIPVPKHTTITVMAKNLLSTTTIKF